MIFWQRSVREIVGRIWPGGGGQCPLWAGQKALRPAPGGWQISIWAEGDRLRPASRDPLSSLKIATVTYVQTLSLRWAIGKED